MKLLWIALVVVYIAGPGFFLYAIKRAPESSRRYDVLNFLMAAWYVAPLLIGLAVGWRR